MSEDPEEFKELLKEEGIEVDTNSAMDLRRKIRVVEELRNVSDLQWTYAKRLLKFGMGLLDLWILRVRVLPVGLWGPRFDLGHTPLGDIAHNRCGGGAVHYHSFHGSKT